MTFAYLILGIFALTVAGASAYAGILLYYVRNSVKGERQDP